MTWRYKLHNSYKTQTHTGNIKHMAQMYILQVRAPTLVSRVCFHDDDVPVFISAVSCWRECGNTPCHNVRIFLILDLTYAGPESNDNNE